MVYAQPSICAEWDVENSLGFWDTNGSPNLDQMTRPYYNQQQQQQKRELAKLWILLSQLTTVKLKESEKKDKYIDLTGEMKKLWNMKVTVIPIDIGAPGTVTKDLVKGLEELQIRGWVETIQTAALLRSARILRRVLETWGYLPLKLQWKTIG